MASDKFQIINICVYQTI